MKCILGVLIAYGISILWSPYVHLDLYANDYTSFLFWGSLLLSYVGMCVFWFVVVLGVVYYFYKRF